MKSTPIAIFTYNRPDHARQLFESLLKCNRLDECSVYIFCDGPKTPEHLPNVMAMRQVAHGFASQINGAVVMEREHNLGLAHSIVDGATELCNRYGRVIVLEDDFLLHPFFIDFMLQSLDRYADDEGVAQVAGYLPPLHLKVESDALFLPLTTSCGWATWQRAWKLFSWDVELAITILEADTSLRSRFNLDDSYPYFDMLRAALAGRVDSWAVLWLWSTFYHGKLTLYPRRSLVWVGGFDSLATHTKQKEKPKFYDQPFDFIMQGNWRSPVCFPNIIQPDESAYKKLKKFLRQKPILAPLIRLKGVLKHNLKQYIKSFRI